MVSEESRTISRVVGFLFLLDFLVRDILKHEYYGGCLQQSYRAFPEAFSWVIAFVGENMDRRFCCPTTLAILWITGAFGSSLREL
ncbi:hypothetical protein ACFX15_014684 [Malus domestica]